MKRKKDYTIYLFVLTALLPIIVLRDYTISNELRYLSIAEEALRDGHFFTFYNHGEIYADKPPLYFWFLMACKGLFGSFKMWVLSLGSLIPAFVICEVMDRWVASYVSWRSRQMGKLMLLSSCFFTVLMVTLRMDMLMCMFIVLALRECYRMTEHPNDAIRAQWLFPLYIFLALFSKGLVGLAMPLVTAVCYLLIIRRPGLILKALGWRTWAVLLPLVVLWMGLTYAEGGAAYMENLLVHQTVGRTIHAFHHARPFYYYALCIWYVFLPWCLMVACVVTQALREGRCCLNLHKFFLTAIGSTFVLLSLVSSKIDVYLLPLFPFVVYLFLMLAPRYENRLWLRLALAIPSLAFAGSLPLLALLSMGQRFSYLAHPVFYAAAALMSVAGLYVAFFLFRGGRVRRGVTILSSAVFVTFFVAGFGMRYVNDNIGYSTLCHTAVRMERKWNTKEFVAYKMGRSENMEVFLGHDIRHIRSGKDLKKTEKPVILLLPKKKLEDIRRVLPVVEVHENVKTAVAVVKWP